MAVEFRIKEVADIYECAMPTDMRIHVPGGATKNGYAGPISGITLKAAELLEKQDPRGNFIRKKTTVTQAKQQPVSKTDNKEY
jgi:hypothetical protein